MALQFASTPSGSDGGQAPEWTAPEGLTGADGQPLVHSSQEFPTGPDASARCEIIPWREGEREFHTGPHTLGPVCCPFGAGEGSPCFESSIEMGAYAYGIELHYEGTLSYKVQFQRGYERSIEDGREQRLYQSGANSVVLKMGYKFELSAEATGTAEIRVPVTVHVGAPNSCQGTYFQPGEPELITSVDANVRLTFEASMALEAGALETVTGGITASFNGGADLTANAGPSSGVSGRASLSFEVTAGGGVEFPSFEVPSPNFCGNKLSVLPSLKGPSASFQVEIYSKTYSGEAGASPISFQPRPACIQNGIECVYECPGWDCPGKPDGTYCKSGYTCRDGRWKHGVPSCPGWDCNTEGQYCAEGPGWICHKSRWRQYTTSCPAWQCFVEGQLCTGGNWICHHGNWRHEIGSCPGWDCPYGDSTWCGQYCCDAGGSRWYNCGNIAESVGTVIEGHSAQAVAVAENTYETVKRETTNWWAATFGG